MGTHERKRTINTVIILTEYQTIAISALGPDWFRDGGAVVGLMGSRQDKFWRATRADKLAGRPDTYAFGQGGGASTKIASRDRWSHVWSRALHQPARVDEINSENPTPATDRSKLFGPRPPGAKGNTLFNGPNAASLLSTTKQTIRSSFKDAFSSSKASLGPTWSQDH